MRLERTVGAVVFAAMLLLKGPPSARAQTQVTNVSVGGSPTAVAVDPATNLVYVADTGAGIVHFLDGDPDRPIVDVADPADLSPVAIAVDPSTGLVYAANADNTVAVIDPSSRSVLSKIPVGAGPSGIVVNPCLGRIYVTNSVGNSVSVLDAATGSVVATVNVGTSPLGLAENPATGQVWVANSGGNSLSVIDEMSLQVTSVPLAASVGGSPAAIAVDPMTNLVFVTLPASNTLVALNGATRQVTGVAQVGPNPVAISVNPATKLLYVANFGAPGASSSVAVCRDSDQPSVEEIDPTQAAGTQAVSVNTTTGKVYAANSQSGSVSVLTPAGTAPTCLVQNPSFETIAGTPPSPGSPNPLGGSVPGWSSLVLTPDVFTTAGGDVPNNVFGQQAPYDGKNYAGISSGRFGGVFLTEALAGTLSPTTAAGQAYSVRAWFSKSDPTTVRADGTPRVTPGVYVEVVFRNSGSAAEQLIGRMTVTDYINWQLFAHNVVANGVYDQIVIRGYDGPNHYAGGYVYIDQVNVCQIPPPTGCLSGMKWNDLNADTVKQAGEPGLAGWTIKATRGSTVLSAVTGAGGAYMIPNVPPGTWTVSEVPQAGWTQTAPAGGSYNATVAGYQSVTGLNFGNTQGQANPCDVSSITINTGFDQSSGGPLPIGASDNFWTVISDPDATTTEPRPATTVPPYPGWQPPLPGTQWISSYPGNVDNLNGEYDFQFCFCLKDGFTHPHLHLDLRADDWAEVFVNGTSVGTTPNPGFNTASPTSIDVTNPALFQAGQNCITIAVHNVYAVAMGLDVAGTMTADGVALQSVLCCHPTGCISGTKWNDLNGDGIHQSGEPPLSGWTIKAVSGSNTYTAVTDSLGHYYLCGLPPGTYTVSEVPQSGWTETAPTAGSYTVTLNPGQSVNGYDFLNVQKPDPCSASSVVINTGYDQVNNTALGIGATDTYWTVTADPDAGTTEPRPATTVLKNPAWANPLPGSQWISSYPSQQDNLNGEYDFQFCFCLKDGYTQPLLQLDLYADDWAEVFLNGTPVGSTPNPGFNTSSPTHISVADPTLFHAGQNCIKIAVHNVFAVAMGLDVAGTVTAGGVSLENELCCEPTGCISGQKWDDLNGDGVHQTSEPVLSGWTIKAVSGSNTYTAITDSQGYYYICGLPPGTYTVSEVPQSGWTQTHPASPGTYTVTITAGHSVNGLDFGNTKSPQQTDQCCANFTKDLTVTALDPNTAGGYTLGNLLFAGPNPITNVRATIVSTVITYPSPACGTSGPAYSYFASATPPTPFTAVLPFAFSREADFNGPASGVNMTSGLPFTFDIRFPPQNTDANGLLCPDQIDFCIRYEFTDAKCVTCDLVKCYTVVRKGGAADQTTKSLMLAAGLMAATPTDVTALDLNGDGKVDLTDAVRLMRAATGLDR